MHVAVFQFYKFLGGIFKYCGADHYTRSHFELSKQLAERVLYQSLPVDNGKSEMGSGVICP
jgi:hypothetical protein